MSLSMPENLGSNPRGDASVKVPHRNGAVLLCAEFGKVLPFSLSWFRSWRVHDRRVGIADGHFGLVFPDSPDIRCPPRPTALVVTRNEFLT